MPPLGVVTSLTAPDGHAEDVPLSRDASQRRSKFLHISRSASHLPADVRADGGPKALGSKALFGGMWYAGRPRRRKAQWTPCWEVGALNENPCALQSGSVLPLALRRGSPCVSACGVGVMVQRGGRPRERRVAPSHGAEIWKRTPLFRIFRDVSAGGVCPSVGAEPLIISSASDHHRARRRGPFCTQCCTQTGKRGPLYGPAGGEMTRPQRR